MADQEELTTDLIGGQGERQGNPNPNPPRALDDKPWYDCLSWFKKEDVLPIANVVPPADEGRADEGRPVAAAMAMPQTLVFGIQGIAAIVSILANLHCGNQMIIAFALLPLCGFLMAAGVELFGCCGCYGWCTKIRMLGIYIVYVGYVGLALSLGYASIIGGKSFDGCFMLQL